MKKVFVTGSGGMVGFRVGVKVGGGGEGLSIGELVTSGTGEESGVPVSWMAVAA